MMLPTFRCQGELYRLKCLKAYLWNPWNALYVEEDKNEVFYTYLGEDDQVATRIQSLSDKDQ